MEGIVTGALIIGFSIIIGSVIVTKVLENAIRESKCGAWQIVKINENELVLLDTRTGKYSRKPVDRKTDVSKQEDGFNKRV